MQTRASFYKRSAFFKPLADNLWDKHSFDNSFLVWSIPVRQKLSTDTEKIVVSDASKDNTTVFNQTSAFSNYSFDTETIKNKVQTS